MPGLAARCLAHAACFACALAAGALAAGALAACGSDDACAPGNARAGDGQTCTVTASPFAIDGDPADWADVPPVAVAPACRADSCTGIAAEALQLARGTDAVGRDALAFHVRLEGGGAPSTEDNLLYVVELRDTSAYPTGSVDRLIFSPGREPRYVRNDFVITTPVGLALPFELELTPDGFEGSIATSSLPFPFGARVSVYATRIDPASQFRLDVVDSTPLVRACWAEAPAGHDPCEGAP